MTEQPAMNRPGDWTGDHDTAARKLHAEGLTLRQTARRLGFSAPVVSKQTKKLGIAWDRSQTKNATEARIADARARRAALEQKFLDEAERSLQAMWDAMEVGAFAGQDGEYKHAWIDQPSPADRKAIMQTASTAAAAAARLADQNAGNETDAAKSALTAMRTALEHIEPQE